LDGKIARTIDVSRRPCPLNFVECVLALEEIEVGELLDVTIEGQEAISNVPRSLKQAGHTIIKVERLESEKMRLIIRRGEAAAP
jgi:tRNA 2-thiouridine synthesizing protein A